MIDPATTNGHESPPVSVESAPSRPRDADGRFLPESSKPDFSSDEKALASLTKIWGGEEEEIERVEATVDTVARNGKAKPKPAEPAIDEPEPEIETTEDADPADADDGVDAEEVALGIQALKRLKMPESALSALSRAELAEYGKVAASQTAERDNLTRENGELKKRLKETAPKSAESPKGESPALDLKALVRPFAEQLDEETGKALEKTLGGIVSYFSSKIDVLERQHGVVAEATETRMLTDSRKELTEKYPSLADQKVYAKVRARMELQQKGDDYGLDFTTLMLHSLRIEGVPEAAKPSPQPNSRAKRNGLPIATAARSTPKAQTKEDRDAAIFNAAEMRGELDGDRLRAYARGS
jgi:hypothetical protein